MTRLGGLVFSCVPVFAGFIDSSNLGKLFLGLSVSLGLAGVGRCTREMSVCRFRFANNLA